MADLVAVLYRDERARFVGPVLPGSCRAIIKVRPRTPPYLQATSISPGQVRSKAELYAYFGEAACLRHSELCYWKDREEFPRLIGFDLDAVLQRRSWPTMLSFLRTALPEWGWELVMSVYRGPTWSCLLARHDARVGVDDDFLQADFHSDFTARGLPFADTALLLNRSLVSNGVRWLDDIDAAVCAYLGPTLANGRSNKRRYSEAFERVRVAAPDRVALLCQAAVGTAAARALRRGTAEAEARSLRRGLIWTAVTRHPFRTARVMLHKFADAVAMYRRPPGQLWTLSGPDGAGKTTVLDLLQPVAERSIVVAVRRLHTRPYVIPRLAALLPQSRRLEALNIRQYEKRLGLLKSLTRLIILVLDLQLGYWLRVRPMLARGDWVIFDRYYQDYLVDSRLRGISLPAAVLHLCGALVPRGDRHVYLTAAAEVLEARKRELSHEDARREIEDYRQLALRDPRAVIVDTSNRPAAAIAKELAGQLLADVRARTAARYGTNR